MQRRVTTRGIIFKDGKIFAQVLKAKTGGRDYWCTPGGGLDVGESLHDGLHREMIEETGVAPKIGRLLFVQQFISGDEEQLEFFFHIENSDDYVDIDISDTSHGDIEVHDFGFIDPVKENLLPQPLQTLNIESYVESVRPVLVMNRLSE